MVTGGGGEFRRVGLEAVVKGISAYKRDVSTIDRSQDQLVDGFRRAGTASEQSAQQIAESMGRAGRAAVIVGGAITAALGFAVKANIDWEQSFVAVAKTVDATEEELEKIEARLRSLSKEIPVSATELARIASLAGQLGVAAGDIITFTEVVAKMAVTTDLGADEASFALAQLINVTGDAVADLDRIGSVIVDLGNNTATTESRILNFAQRIAATATNVGITTPEILALSASVLSLGINTERGATAIGQGLIRIQKAVADGGEELRVFAKTAGLSVTDFVELWETDALGAFQAFVGGIGAAGGDAVLILEDVGLAGFRATDAFQALGRAGDQLTTNVDRATEALAENVALEEEFARFADTTAARLTIAWNEFRDVLITAGADLIPILETGIDLARRILQTWEALPGPVRTVIVLASALAGALTLAAGVALIFAGQIISGVAALTALAATSATASAALTVLRLAMVAIPFLAAATVGLALISALGLLGGSATEAADRVDDLTDRLEDQIRAAANRGEQITRDDALVRELTETIIGWRVETGLATASTEAMDAAQQAVNDTNIKGGNEWDRLVSRLVAARDASERHTDNTAELRGEIDALGERLAAVSSRWETVDEAADELGITVEMLIDLFPNLSAAIEENARATADADLAQAALGKTVRQTARDLQNLTSSALEARIALRIFEAQSDATGFALINLGDLIGGEIEQLRALFAQDAAIREIVATLRKSLGFVEPGGGAAAIEPAVVTPFGRFREAIERARREAAAEIALDVVEAARLAGEAEAASIAAFAVAFAESEADIITALQEIERRFPALAGVVDQALGRISGRMEQTSDELDQLGRLIVTALRRQAEATRDIALAAIDERRDAERRAHDDRLSEIDELERREIAAIEASRDSRIGALQAELAALGQEQAAEERAGLERQLALAFDPRERARIEEQIREFDRRQRAAAIREEIAQIREGASAEIEAAQDTADGRREALETTLEAAIIAFDREEEAARAAFAAQTEAFALESEARRLVMAGEVDEIGRLLEAFVPEWRAAGQSFGEQLIEGLQASGVQAFVAGIIQQFLSAIALRNVLASGAGAVSPNLSGAGGTSQVMALASSVPSTGPVSVQPSSTTSSTSVALTADLSGSTFLGSPEENADAIRNVFDEMLEEQFGPFALEHGVLL